MGKDLFLREADLERVGVLIRVGAITERRNDRAGIALGAEGLAIAANEGAISLHPNFISHLRIPNVVMVPIAEKDAAWDLFVVWQRGKTSGPLRRYWTRLLRVPTAGCEMSPWG